MRIDEMVVLGNLVNKVLLTVLYYCVRLFLATYWPDEKMDQGKMEFVSLGRIKVIAARDGDRSRHRAGEDTFFVNEFLTENESQT